MFWALRLGGAARPPCCRQVSVLPPGLRAAARPLCYWIRQGVWSSRTPMVSEQLQGKGV